MDFNYTNGADSIYVSVVGNYFGLNGNDTFSLAQGASLSGTSLDGGGGIDTLYVYNSRAYSLHADFTGIGLNSIEQLVFGGGTICSHIC